MLKASRELAFALGEAGANLASKFESEAATARRVCSTDKCFYGFLFILSLSVFKKVFVIVNWFFSVFLSFRTYPIGIDGATECFYCELACKEKHTGAASETHSRPERKCFYGFRYRFRFR